MPRHQRATSCCSHGSPSDNKPDRVVVVTQSTARGRCDGEEPQQVPGGMELLDEVHELPSPQRIDAPPSSPRLTESWALLPEPPRPSQQRVAATSGLFYSVQTIGSEALDDCNGAKGLPQSTTAAPESSQELPKSQQLYQLRSRFTPAPDRGQAPHLEHLFKQRWYDQRAPPKMSAFAARSLGRTRRMGEPAHEFALSRRLGSAERIAPARVDHRQHRGPPQMGKEHQLLVDLRPVPAPVGPVLETVAPRNASGLMPPAYRAPPSTAKTGTESRARLARPASAPVLRQQQLMTRASYGAQSTKVRPGSAQVLPHVQHDFAPDDDGPHDTLTSPPPGAVALKPVEEPYLARLRRRRVLDAR